MEVFFSFHNNPKNLDLSYKTDLDFWDCLKGTHLIAEFHKNDLGVIAGPHSAIGRAPDS